MPPLWLSRPAVLASAAGALAAAVTYVVVQADVRIADDDGYRQMALDSAASTIGLLLAYLLYGRFRRSCQVRDALLWAALLLLGTGNALLAVLPPVVEGQGRLTTASAVSGLVAASLFAAAGAMPTRTFEQRLRPWVPLMVGAGSAGVLVLAVGVDRVLPDRGTGSADTFGGTSDLWLTGAQAAAAALFTTAAVGLCRPTWRDDQIAAPLAAAGVLGAASRLAFAVAPGPDVSWVAAGTLLRALFYLTLVVVAGVEIRGYWRREAQLAVLEERRRMARDLHDGLAQEVAFAATQARALAERSEHPTRARLVAAAAERALDESRRAIAALTRPLDEPIEVTLAQCAEEVCDRYDATLELDVQPGIRPSPEVREALLRILREAVSNAVRHGQAHAVTVRLAGPGPVRLVIEDDGAGFDPADLRHLSGRFGLVSMRERAEALGGTFTLASRSPGGTRVEVELP